MGAFASPADLAAALYCEGRRPIDGARVAKFVGHIETQAQYDEALAALPESVRGQVRALADPFLRAKGLESGVPA